MHRVCCIPCTKSCKRTQRWRGSAGTKLSSVLSGPFSADVPEASGFGCLASACVQAMLKSTQAQSPSSTVVSNMLGNYTPVTSPAEVPNILQQPAGAWQNTGLWKAPYLIAEHGDATSTLAIYKGLHTLLEGLVFTKTQFIYKTQFVSSSQNPIYTLF